MRVGVPAENRTEYLPNTSLESNLWTVLFGETAFRFLQTDKRDSRCRRLRIAITRVQFWHSETLLCSHEHRRVCLVERRTGMWSRSACCVASRLANRLVTVRGAAHLTTTSSPRFLLLLVTKFQYNSVAFYANLKQCDIKILIKSHIMRKVWKNANSPQN
jgi:hypothetical protein